MIEPAALGKPVIVGPFTQNFADAMQQFLAGDSMRVIQVPGGWRRQSTSYWQIPPSEAISASAPER